MATSNELPLGFYFAVDLNTTNGSKSLDNPDAKFQSVSGLSVDVETEEFAEGGENHFKHKLPVRTKYPNLVLKRAIMANSEIIDWCRDAIENFNFSPKDMSVFLYNQEKEIIFSWNIVHAYPIKWSVDAFNAEESKIVIETLELSYDYFTWK